MARAARCRFGDLEGDEGATGGRHGGEDQFTLVPVRPYVVAGDQRCVRRRPAGGPRTLTREIAERSSTSAILSVPVRAVTPGWITARPMASGMPGAPLRSRAASRSWTVLRSGSDGTARDRATRGRSPPHQMGAAERALGQGEFGGEPVEEPIGGAQVPDLGVHGERVHRHVHEGRTRTGSSPARGGRWRGRPAPRPCS
ncbi:hypothetical protein IQ64_34755 [Streptomyces stelliscabiei]|nr:hypothetical protein IQ64_34755 [Streptomyces stelliscabiei]